jgi:hypothetical protein
MDRIEITGATFPHRELIKGLGGRWDANAKVWWFDKNSFSNRQWEKISAEIHRANLRMVRSK